MVILKNPCRGLTSVIRYREVELLSIACFPETRGVRFIGLKTLHLGSKPVSLEGNILTLSNESSKVRIVDWRTGHYAVLQSDEEQEEEAQVRRVLS